jgi:hypothetical protein
MNESEPKDSPPGVIPKAGRPETDRPEGPQDAPADIHAYIGARLREVYNDVARQPIPDRFLELMRQLDAK